MYEVLDKFELCSTFVYPQSSNCDFFQGCYNSLTSWLLAYLNPVLITIIILISVEMIAVIFAFCLCKGIERELRRK